MSILGINEWKKSLSQDNIKSSNYSKDFLIFKWHFHNGKKIFHLDFELVCLALLE
jgi:hypothetical protein